jgi:hypothetical protein
MNILQYFHDTPDELVFWSFRYFLGRKTIRSCTFAEDLAKALPHMDKRVVHMIREELEEAFARKNVGMACDRSAWERVRQAYADKKNKEAQP